MSRRTWVAAVALIVLLTAARLFFPGQLQAWRNELRRLLTDTADSLEFVEALGRSLCAADRTGESMQTFFPATDGIEEQTRVLPSFPPL